MVRDVFDQGKLMALRGWMGLSHGKDLGNFKVIFKGVFKVVNYLTQ